MNGTVKIWNGEQTWSAFLWSHAFLCDPFTISVYPYETPNRMAVFLKAFPSWASQESGCAQLRSSVAPLQKHFLITFFLAHATASRFCPTMCDLGTELRSSQAGQQVPSPAELSHGPVHTHLPVMWIFCYQWLSRGETSGVKLHNAVLQFALLQGGLTRPNLNPGGCLYV